MSAVFIFDMDGVIADSWPAFFQSCCKVLGDMGHHQLCNEKSILAMFEVNFLQGLKSALAPDHLSEQHLIDLSLQLNQMMAEVPSKEAAVPVVKTLLQQYPLYLVTSNFTATAKDFLNRFELNGFRDVLGLDKNVSKVVKIQAIVAKHPNSSVFYIGDTLGDIHEAHEAGVTAIAAGWGWHDTNTLSKGNPDYLLSHPSELLEIAQKIHR